MEECEAERERLAGELAAAERRLAARQAELMAERTRLDEQRQRLLGERAAALQRLSPQTAQLYERLRERGLARGLAAVQQRKCQGCYVELPTNLQAMVLAGRELVRCPQCGRFLYAEEGTAAARSYRTSTEHHTTPMPGD
ncbi:MAG: hypothetical protein KatS3mg102_1141 [Planctomycetota bacterium]|nr:MAG: hypothetical protein KatS3mg102_1141 [Planctomycetota bacterium]